MTNAFEVLELLEKTSSTKQKIAILKENVQNTDLAQILSATFDYRKRYYMKQLPDVTGTSAQQIISARGIMVILAACEIDGRTQECKESVTLWLNSLSPLAAKWYRRVILRDLRCGVSLDTALKAGFDIPSFEVQLATDAKKCKKLVSMITKGVRVSAKLDGYRCLAVGSVGVFTLYTRNGNVYENFPTIKAELERMFPEGDYVFDGEIMSDSFSDMQKSAFASKRKTTVGDVKYHVFDMIPPSEWSLQEFTVGYEQRYQNLEDTLVPGSSELVGLVPHYKSCNLEEIQEFQQLFESRGYEGAMCNPDIPYYMGRKHNALLKFKSMETWDCTITGFVEGKGRLAGSLGKVLVAQPNGLTGEVGSGFDDAERAYLWANKDANMNRIIECKFQELTDDGFMRFPIFLRFRDQGDGNKI